MTIRSKTALATAALVVATAAVLSPAQAATRPIDATERQQLEAGVDALALAGGFGVIAGVDSGRSRFRDAAGVRTIDGAEPARPSDTARVASVSKPMVSVLALQEVQRGRWSLTTTVGEVLPGLLPGHEQVTLEQLLSHRSGVPDYLLPIIVEAKTTEAYVKVLSRSYTPRQLVRAALTQPWAFTPGTDYLYSNTNYVVVGLMLEKLNRRPVGSLLERRVFGPAKMASSTFQTGRTWGQRAHLTGYAQLERPVNLDRTNASLFYAAGAVESTPADLNRFWRSVLDGTLLDSRWAAEMVRPRTAAVGYGLGALSVPGPCAGPDGKPQLMYGHDGATFGTQTLAFTTPDGRTQASVSWTGRDLVNVESPDTLAAIALLRDGIAVDCVKAPAPRTSKVQPYRMLDSGLARR